MAEERCRGCSGESVNGGDGGQGGRLYDEVKVTHMKLGWAMGTLSAAIWLLIVAVMRWQCEQGARNRLSYSTGNGREKKTKDEYGLED